MRLMAERNTPAAEQAPDDLQRALEDVDYTGRKHGPRLAQLVGGIAALW